MNSNQSSVSKSMETDIVVVGAGGAGLTAAVAATEKGANVIVVEKRRKPGGMSAMAGGLFAAESPVQKRLRCDVPKDEIYKLYMEHAHWKIDQKIIRTFVNMSADTIQWMEDKGVVFEQICSNYPGQYPLTWHAMMPREGGRVIINMLKEQCESLGVQVITQGTGKRIVVDNKGKVQGLTVETKDGDLDISARVVIIATGGYGGNRDLLKKYCPYYHENLRLMGPPHMGEGLLMAMETGAATEHLGNILTHGPMCPGFSEVDALARQPETVWVNKFGERFTDECITFRGPECGNSVDRQPEMTTYTLLDDSIKQDRAKNGISTLHVDVVVSTPLDRLGDTFERAVSKGMAVISDSWEEVAVWMGASPQTLISTINEYNTSCDRGYDELLCKDRRYLKPLRKPPFYAIRCFSSYVGTLGGVKINHRVEAVDNQGEAIPGLYVAGNDAGSWVSDTYNLATGSGSAFGFAINSGRMAGENAIDYIGKN